MQNRKKKEKSDFFIYNKKIFTSLQSFLSVVLKKLGYNFCKKPKMVSWGEKKGQCNSPQWDLLFFRPFPHLVCSFRSTTIFFVLLVYRFFLFLEKICCLKKFFHLYGARRRHGKQNKAKRCLSGVLAWKVHVVIVVVILYLSLAHVTKENK